MDITVCMFIDHENYKNIRLITDALLKQTVSMKNIIVYIDKDYPVDTTQFSETFDVRTCEHNLGSLTALIAALNDAQEMGNLLILSDEIIYERSRLSTLISTILNIDSITALTGYEVYNYDTILLNIPHSRTSVYGSVIDTKHGYYVPRKALSRGDFDIDMIRNDFKGMEDLYLSYVLSKKGMIVYYPSQSWHYILRQQKQFVDQDFWEYTDINKAIDEDHKSRAIMKYSYLMGTITAKDICNKKYVYDLSDNFNKHSYPLYYISFTSFAKRLPSLRLMIPALKRQRELIYAVNIWLDRSEWTDDELDELRRLCLGFIDIRFTAPTSVKWKSYNKMIPQLTDGWFKRFNTLTIDDDLVYPPDFIKRRLDMSASTMFRLPNSISIFNAHIYQLCKSHAFHRTNAITCSANIIEGFSGIWYPSSVIESIYELLIEGPDIDRYGYADDIYISALFKRLGIPVYGNSFDNDICYYALPHIEPLYMLNNGENGNNIKAISAFLKEPDGDNVLEIHLSDAMAIAISSGAVNINTILREITRPPSFIILTTDNHNEALKQWVQFLPIKNIAYVNDLPVAASLRLNLG